MTALDEYEKLASGKGPDVDPDDIFDYADAAIESLKCCGNCVHLDWVHDDDEVYWCCHADRTFRRHTRLDPCHFTPSRWKERV